MIIPVVIGAIALGRAFDIYSATVKAPYIFDQNAINETLQSVPRTFVQSHYRMTETSSEVNDFLNVDGELAIKVKKGQIDLQGSGSYLAKTVNRDQAVEILITVYHETLTETFPSYVKLRDDWQGKPTQDVGTHYIRSIVYGGQLIISYLLKANKKEYLQDIKAAVTANLAVSGSVDLGASGNFEKLAKEVGNISSTEIQAYATAGPSPPLQSYKDVIDLVERYPAEVKKLNGGKGSYLKLELVPLETLSPNRTAYWKNYALEGVLNEANNKYDDVRLSSSLFKDWDNQGNIWNDEQQAKVDEYWNQLKKAERAFRSAITSLDGAGSLNQFDEAFKVYGENGENIPNKYARALVKLQHTLEEKPFNWFPYTKAISHYVHWGSLNCTLPSPEPVYIGVAGTSPKGFGNGGNMQCLRAGDPNLEDKKLSDGTVVSHINGMKYELPDGSKGPVLCSFCRLENATTAFTIAGRSKCPPEMKLEYSGYLMTSKDAGTASTFVCLNKQPDTKFPKFDIGSDNTSATLEPVWMTCPDCDQDENKKYVGCIVCSR